ncbi:MAG: S-adenosylmethionine:tRNA ribosyltransferase-isomerase [Bacteroidetes bacterium]|nr:S-adenosylmethionine:tRNA ribosyltransferase-isomerase [Bacteroidota bacterium]
MPAYRPLKLNNDVYTLPQDISVQTALQALLLWMQRQQNHESFATQLPMTPAYTMPRVADAIITNFHQPKSTLLLLIGLLCRHNNGKRFIMHYNINFLIFATVMVFVVEEKRDEI